PGPCLLVSRLLVQGEAQVVRGLLVTGPGSSLPPGLRLIGGRPGLEQNAQLVGRRRVSCLRGPPPPLSGKFCLPIVTQEAAQLVGRLGVSRLRRSSVPGRRFLPAPPLLEDLSQVVRGVRVTGLRGPPPQRLGLLGPPGVDDEPAEVVGGGGVAR